MAERQEINPSRIKGCASSWEKYDDGLPILGLKAPSPKYVSLVDSLSSEWLKLPLVIMQDVGPAVQTLGGLLNITNRETFSPVEEIARRSRLPFNTTKKHLVTLNAAGWIHNAGRGHTKARKAP